MIKLPKTYEVVQTAFNEAVQLGIGGITATNEEFTGRILEVNGQPKVNFISNGYLGFERDPRVIKASNEATERFGIHASISRSYLKFKPQEELEAKLEQMLGLPVTTCLTTTLGHFAILPTLIGKNDAVILDQFVHASVHMTAQYLRGAGIYTELVRHNQLEDLEKRIRVLSEKYDNIWYLADSVYSMHGDVAPLKDIEVLLNGYDNFYCYLDDAHGISWIGEHGKGFALDKISHNDKLFLITSLNKGFGGFCSALVFPNQEMKNLVSMVGTSLIFSTPPNHSTIGSALAIADIHLSDEIYVHQNTLQNKVRHFIKKAKSLNLPLSNELNTPIFFVYTGNFENCLLVTKHLQDSGFILSPASYPSVPLIHSGVRVSLNAYQTISDIDNLLEATADILHKLEVSGKLNREVLAKTLHLKSRSAVKTV